MRQNLIDPGPGRAVIDARAGGPIPFELAIFIDACALLANADHDALIRHNGQFQENIRGGNDDLLANADAFDAVVGLLNVQIGDAIVPGDADDALARLDRMRTRLVFDGQHGAAWSTTEHGLLNGIDAAIHIERARGVKGGVGLRFQIVV